MNWIVTYNNKKINALEIPVISIDEMKNSILALNKRPVGFFGKQEFENVRLYVVLADDYKGEFYVSSVIFPPDVKSYNSLTPDIPSLHMFEREFWEEFNITPINHPWLKPVRKNQDEYPFFKMQGEGVHEVAVGPIHAGVIEPGHFRFMCQGEKVYNLEIMLGYQNRGAEKLLIEGNKINNRLMESISGDTVVGYNKTYSELMETLSGTKITNKAQIIRRIALELERIAIHIGDLGAIAGDIAYLMGASVFAVTRTLVINTLLEITGSRFARGLIDVGGVNFDIDDKTSLKIMNMLDSVQKTVIRTSEIMLKEPSCISRMEKTGVLSRENAQKLGIVGMAARASGVKIDSRFDYKDKWYLDINCEKPYRTSGDVYSRFNLRYSEIIQSIYMIKGLLEKLKEYKNEELKVQVQDVAPHSFVVSTTEGWRGEIVHIAITGENSEFLRYKIKDPSFNNWYALALAVRNNGISDFPVCNKSFNLSYCGFDL